MSRLKKNILFNFAGQGIVILLSLLSFKYIYKDLGQDALGIIYFTLMLGMLLSSALDIGLTKTTTREVAANFSDDLPYIIRLLQTFSLFYWLAYVIVLLAYLYLIPFILESWINLDSMSLEIAYSMLMVLGVSALLAIPRIFLVSILAGLQRMDISNYVEIFITVIQQCGLIILLFGGADVMTIAYWIAMNNVIKMMAYMFYIAKLVNPSVLLPIFSFDVIGRIKSYASRMMWVSLLLVIHKQLDKVLISKFLPIGVMGIYSFTYSSISKTSLITSSVAQAVFPSFAELDKEDKRKESLDRYYTLQDFLVFGTLPIFIFVIYFSLPLFTFLLNVELAYELRTVVFLLCVCFYLNAVMRLVRTYLFAIGVTGPAIKADVISLLLVSPATVLLVYYFGLNGAALSSVLYYVVMAGSIIPKVYNDVFEQSPHLWFRAIAYAIGIAILIYVPAGLISYYYFESILMHFVFFIIASILYGVVTVNIAGIGLKRAIVKHIPAASRLVRI